MNRYQPPPVPSHMVQRPKAEQSMVLKVFAVIGVVALVAVAVIFVWGVFLTEPFTVDLMRIHLDCIRPPLSNGGGLCLVESR